jgi:hypothetical protein
MGAEAEDRAARPSWRQRACAAGLLLLAVAGAAATVVVWRADAADLRGDFARALWWRPRVPMYQRQVAETLLFNDPAAAEAHLLRALRDDPYDNSAAADLDTVELELGRWPRALALTQAETGRQALNFAARWRLANLYLSHADLTGFWQQAALASRFAPAGVFPSLVNRALTASGNDFTALRRALPPASVPAAAAFAQAAAERGDSAACRQAAAWLLGLEPDTAEADAERRRALLALLTNAWRQRPSDAGPLSVRLHAAGLLPDARPADTPALLDGDFDPRREAAARLSSPDPAAELSAVVGWRWFSLPGLDAQQVETGDATHPTAAYFAFDGSQADQGLAAEQWLLARGGDRLAVTAWVRRLDPADSGGLGLRLARLDGAPVAGLPLLPGDGWQAVTAAWRVPGQGMQTLRLQIVYQRPLGQMPLHNRILLTGLRLTLAAAAPADGAAAR